MLRRAEDDEQFPLCIRVRCDPLGPPHARARSVYDPAAARRQRVIYRARDAVRADQDRCAFRDLLCALHGHHAGAFQPRDLVVVMDELPEAEKGPFLLKRLFRKGNAVRDAGAEAGMLSKDQPLHFQTNPQ